MNNADKRSDGDVLLGRILERVERIPAIEERLNKFCSIVEKHTDRLNEHHVTLYTENDGGLSGAQNRQKGSLRTLKWIAGSALGVAVTKIVHDLFSGIK